jgi:SCY1-like protein 2
LQYTNTVTYLASRGFPGAPPDLSPELQRLTHPDRTHRPDASAFSTSPWFRDDIRLRALRFLDHMLERDNMAKSSFLKSLGGMWPSFDSRVLRFKVLPPLAAELRNEALQQQILPMIMAVAEQQVGWVWVNPCPFCGGAVGQVWLTRVRSVVGQWVGFD